MICTAAPDLRAAPSSGAFGPLVDLDRLVESLRGAAAWPPELEGAAVSVRRLWVGRGTRVSFELLITPPSPHPDRPLVVQGGFDALQEGSGSGSGGGEVRPCAHGLGGLSFRDERDGLWLCTPDRDPRLTALGDFLDPDRCGLHLGVFGPPPTGLAGELIAWRAGRRAMLRIRPANRDRGGVCVKLFRRSPGEARRALHAELAAHLNRTSGGRLRLPPILSIGHAPAMILTQEIEAAAPLTRSATDLDAAAETLVRLHAAPVTLDGEHRPRAELQTVCRWMRLLRAAMPSASARLKPLVRALTQSLRELDWAETGPVHRDYYQAQLLRRGEVVWLTDLDTLTRGHAEVDVATFSAHLALDALLGGDAPATAGRAILEFTERYAALGGRPDPARMDFYLACALLRLGALHGARGRPAEVVDALWELAGRRLREPSRA